MIYAKIEEKSEKKEGRKERGRERKKRDLNKMRDEGNGTRANTPTEVQNSLKIGRQISR